MKYRLWMKQNDRGLIHIGTWVKCPDGSSVEITGCNLAPEPDNLYAVRNRVPTCLICIGVHQKYG